MYPTKVSVLGGLTVEIGRTPVDLGGIKQRTVLARLVVAYPDVVDAAELSHAVWPGCAPRSKSSSLHAYISRLRKILDEGAIQHEQGGYRFRVDEGQADWLQFKEAVDLGDRAVAAGRHAEAVSVLEPALGLWSGDRALGALADTRWAEAFEAELDQARRVCVTRLAAAQLGIGAFDDAAATLVRGDLDPYDETPVDIAMRAHYFAGRQAEALSVFDRFRASLAEELGIDPSPGLAKLQLDVLQQRPDLAWKAPDATPPRLLPPRVHRLSGRRDEIRHIEKLLDRESRVVLFGLAGSGKSTIATEIAHSFPGPVCWVPADDESAALGALTELGFRIGVPRGLGRDELLAALWERLSALTDWLLVIDNAGGPEHARWLLPPKTSRGKVLLTSLDPSWVSDAAGVRINALDSDVSAAFLLSRTSHVRGDGLGPSPALVGAADRLARELGGLPLALEQACVYMTQTGMGLATYLNHFRTKQAQLLVRGAPSTHPSPAGTSWLLLFESVRRRSPAAADMLELASFLSADGVPWPTLTSGVESEDPFEWLDAVIELVRCSLVDRDDAELRVHRLVQAVVRSELTPAERERQASRAADLLVRVMPSEASDPVEWPRWSALLPQVDALLRAAQDCQVAPAELPHLICGCAAHLRQRSGLLLAKSLLNPAITLYESSGDDSHGLALLYAQRSEICDDLGELDGARSDIMTALGLAGPATSQTAHLQAAQTWARLAHVLNCADERNAAVDLYERAIALFHEYGAREDLVGSLIGLAYTRWGQDDYQAAIGNCREAIDLLDGAGWTGHPLHPAALSALGMMFHETGQLSQACELQLAALAELDSIHGDADHHDKAYVWDKLGYAKGLLGRHEESLAAHQRAIHILGNLFGERDARLAVAISNRGLAQAGLGALDAARRSQEAAQLLLLTAFGREHKLTRLVSHRLSELQTLSSATATAMVGGGGCPERVLSPDPATPDAAPLPSGAARPARRTRRR
ncbi:MAG TPA: BTAD domain-containing putative transcriptional regulator [Microlunatus sp.]